MHTVEYRRMTDDLLNNMFVYSIRNKDTSTILNDLFNVVKITKFFNKNVGSKRAQKNPIPYNKNW